MKRFAALLATALAGVAGVGAARPAGGAPPLCRASLHLAPSSPFVGQQVAYRLRIERRKDVPHIAWERAPSFPALRAEWLPPLSAADASAPGETWRITEERRALYPARPGLLQIPEAVLRCERPQGGEVIVVPAAQLVARRVPASGQPPGWRGLVGPLHARLRALPGKVSLGSSIRVSLELWGSANVWDSQVDLEKALAGTGTEIFPAPPTLSRDTGRRLVVRQFRRYDLVPHHMGKLEIPALRIPWWDPRSETWSETTTHALNLQVSAAAAPPARAAAPRSAQSPRAKTTAGEAAPALRRLERLGLLALAGALLAGGIALLRRLLKSRAAAAPDPVATALRRAARAEREGDPEAMAAALGRALRAALEPSLPGATTLSAQECFANAPDPARDLALLLQKLERARFTPGDSASELRDLRRRLEARCATTPGRRGR